MAFRQGNFFSAESGADLSTKQYYVVKTDSTGKVVLASAGTDVIKGVLSNAPKLGVTADVADINGNGSFQVILGGTVAKDALLTTDANGKAVAAVTTGHRAFGRAVVAGVANDIIEYQRTNEKI